MILLRAAAVSVSLFLAVAANQIDYFASDGHPAQEPFPHPGPPAQDHSDAPLTGSVYQVLSADPKFSKLVKIINISDDIVSLLNDTSAGITFFAPTNEAFPRQRHHHHHQHALVEDTEHSSYTFSDVLSFIDELDVSPANTSDKNKRREWLAKLVKIIASYHVLPSVFDASALGRNMTFASNLTLFTEQPLRVRALTLLLPPRLYINLWSQVVQKNIIAGNGVIHAINRPLLPPPPAFTALFLFPSAFSTLTSAIQRVGLTSELDLKYIRGKDGEKGTLEGAKTVTFFAPTNKAFHSIPPRLKLFLFSPAGATALKKLLEYHIAPGAIVHSDYLYNISVDAAPTNEFSGPPCLHAFNHEGHGLYRLLSADSGLDGPFKHHGHGPPCHRPSFGHEDWHYGKHDQEHHHGERRGPHHEWHHEHAERHHPHESFKPEGRRHGRDHENRGHPGEHHLEKHGHHPHPPQSDEGRHGPEGHRHPSHFEDEWQHGPGRKHQDEEHRSNDRRPPSHHPGEHPPPGSPPGRFPVYSANLTLPTLLTNHTLHVHVAQFKSPPHFPVEHYTTRVFVNGIPVAVSDLPMSNGAVHAVNRLLVPRHKRKEHKKPKDGDEEEPEHNFHREEHHNAWEDWEDWFIQWVNEN